MLNVNLGNYEYQILKSFDTTRQLYAVYSNTASIHIHNNFRGMTSGLQSRRWELRVGVEILQESWEPEPKSKFWLLKESRVGVEPKSQGRESESYGFCFDSASLASRALHWFDFVVGRMLHYGLIWLFLLYLLVAREWRGVYFGQTEPTNLCCVYTCRFDN